jgi:hypothetical protein
MKGKGLGWMTKIRKNEITVGREIKHGRQKREK